MVDGGGSRSSHRRLKSTSNGNSSRNDIKSTSRSSRASIVVQ